MNPIVKRCLHMYKCCFLVVSISRNPTSNGDNSESIKFDHSLRVEVTGYIHGS